MGSMVVVVKQKGVHVLAHYADGSEHIGVENFGSKCTVEALDERVLRGFAWLDEGQGHAVLAAPQI